MNISLYKQLGIAFIFFGGLCASCQKDDVLIETQEIIATPSYSISIKLGEEMNLFPNVPENALLNPYYIGSQYRHKQFGSGCLGKNDTAYFVTRVADGHGISGGNLYWSKTTDEGETWTPLVMFSQDICDDSSSEDLRDCTIYYDELLEKYFLIYVHQYGIVDNDYSNIRGELKVFVGNTPFEAEMIDISPGTHVPLDGLKEAPSMQTFETPHRIGSSLYLPVYQHGNPTSSVLLKFTYNDSMPFIAALQWMKWDTVYKWQGSGDDETTLYLAPQDNGAPRIFMLSRRHNDEDKGWLTFSDDGGETWTEKKPLGFAVAGGPRVFYINGIFMLVAREQSKIGDKWNSEYVYAMFSSDGIAWKNRIIISDQGAGYPSLVNYESGKTLLYYGKEVGHLGVQLGRRIELDVNYLY